MFSRKKEKKQDLTFHTASKMLQHGLIWLWSVQDVIEREPLAICNVFREKNLIRKSKFFLAKKHFFKSEIEISTFQTQDIIWSGPLTWHTVNLALTMNCIGLLEA